MNRAIPALLAVLGPLLVLGAGAASVYRFEPERPKGAERELANAGRVMNGRRLNKSVVEQMEQELQRHQPDVLILGNSYANTNIDPKRVARALDLPPKKVRVLSVPNSVGSHWYAILKNRVYANGHHPRLILVVSPLQSMLLTEPYSESSYTNLWVHLGEHEPLLDQLVPRSNLVVRQLRQRRGAVRDAWLASVRDAAIGMVHDGGRLANEDAMDRVFHDQNVDMERYVSAMPVVERRDPRGETGPGAVPHPDDSMLSHLSRLATENGSRLVFVRSPMAPRTPADELDAVPDGWEVATHELLASAGHVLADLSALPMQDALFHNPGHMSGEGSKLFTDALVEVLEDQALYTKRGKPTPWRIAAPEVRLSAAVEPDDLARQLGAQLLPPGTALTVSFADGWQSAPRTWKVQLRAEQLSDGALPRVTIDGRQVGVRQDGHMLEVDTPRPPPSGPWSVELTNPELGSPLLVHGLRVGTGLSGRQVLGRAASFRPAEVELLGDLSLREGQLSIASPEVEFAEEPPPVEPAIREVTANRRRKMLGAIEAADLDHLSDARTRSLTALGSRCSPVRVLEDGVPLPLVHESCSDKTRGRLGRVCHGPNKRVVFSTSDGESVRSGRRYTLALDRDRSCLGALWLYPGDRVRILLRSEVLAPFRRGATRLETAAASADGSAALLPVTLRASGEVLLQDMLPAGGDRSVTLDSTLSRPLEPDETGSIEIANPGPGFVLLTRASLQER